MRSDPRNRKEDIKPRKKVRNPLNDLNSIKLACDLFFIRRGMDPHWDTEWEPSKPHPNDTLPD